MAMNRKRWMWIVLGAIIATVAILISWFALRDSDPTSAQTTGSQPSGTQTSAPQTSDQHYDDLQTHAPLDGVVPAERQQEIASADTSVTSNDVVPLAIGGYDIPLAEFQHALDAVRNDVVRQLAEDGESVGAEFWARADAGSPSAIAAEAAVAWLEKRYGTYIVAVEAGLVESASWDALNTRLMMANGERADAIDRGEVVYGLPQYDLTTFVEYEESGFFEAFIANESLPNMALTEDEIEAFFATHEWALADGAIPTLADVRPNVVREARVERYEAMLEQQQGQILIDVDYDALTHLAADYLA